MQKRVIVTKMFLPALCAGLLAGCATVPTPANSGSYFMMGTEPGWALTVDGNRADLVTMAGEKMRYQVTSTQEELNGRRYVLAAPDASQTRVQVTYAACSDGMSDRRWGHSVVVTRPAEVLRGCGGPELPPPDLAATSWQVISINGAAVADAAATKIIFARGTVSANFGCNLLNGPYVADGQRMTVGALMSTRKGCPADLAQRDNAFAALAAVPVSMRFTPEGHMVLNGGGQSFLLRRNRFT